MWSNDTKCKYMFMFPLKNLARKGLNEKSCNPLWPDDIVWYQRPLSSKARHIKQGKSEGFESCYRPIVRKRLIWVKIGDVLSRVTLKFDGWPWKTIGHLYYATSSSMHHFVAIGEFKLELQSGNAQFGSKSMIFLAVWPCNLMYDLEKQ